MVFQNLEVQSFSRVEDEVAFGPEKLDLSVKSIGERVDQARGMPLGPSFCLEFRPRNSYVR